MTKSLDESNDEVCLLLFKSLSLFHAGLCHYSLMQTAAGLRQWQSVYTLLQFMNCYPFRCGKFVQVSVFFEGKLRQQFEARKLLVGFLNN